MKLIQWSLTTAIATLILALWTDVGTATDAHRHPVRLAPDPPQEGTLHACVDRNRHGSPHGLLRMVLPTEPCHRGEVRVVWNVQGPAGPEGPAGAQGPTGPQGPAGPAGGGGLAVYDKDGVKVGNVVSFDESFQPVVLFQPVLPDGLLLDVLVPLRVFPMHLGGTQSFYYNRFSCEGQPYMTPPPTDLGPSGFYPLSWAATDLPGGAVGAWLYGPPTEADPLELALRSIRHPDGTCETPTSEATPVVPAVPQVNLDLFKPPFALR